MPEPRPGISAAREAGGSGTGECEPGVGVAGVTEIIVLATGDTGGGKVEGLGVLTVSS